MNLLRYCFVALAFGTLVVIAGCSQSGPNYSSVTVDTKSHTFEVQAKGEIVATEEVSIAVPGNVNMSFQLLWLVPEYSEVKKGDVIARFDDAQVLTEIQRRELEIQQRELELATFELGNEATVMQIIHSMTQVEGETDIAENYKDLEEGGAFTMHEIIDAIDNLEYLSVQRQFYQWEKESNQRQFDAETQRIGADMQMSQEGLERNKKALDIMELKSPEDGTFVYASMRWGGGKISPGMTIWRGYRIGSLPIRGKVKAEIHVLEVDAVGIQEGQKVDFRIDSAMEYRFTGTITDVPRMARSLDGFDPTKYRIISAEFDEIDPELMRVGSSISATITTDELEDVILVPQQAVFFDEDKPHVYVIANKADPELRYVELGRKSPTLIEISSGLEAGERISLVAPTQSST
ncbi:MAG: hypothetical protein OXG24_08195 [Gammaproteobacteria bacterium]|nr:hypothetical protein [Gammaproteobacteria bacterium]